MRKMSILSCCLLSMLLAGVVQAGLEKEDLLRIRQFNREQIEKLQEAVRSARQPFHLEVDGQEDFDVTSYRLDLAIDMDNQLLDGSVTVTATSLVPGLDRIILDFYDDMPVSSVTGNASAFTHADNLVTIDLDQAYNTGQSFEVTVSYSGHPWEGILGMGFVNDNSTYNRPLVYTECSPFFARAWWPCKDTPADKANTMDLYITLPNTLVLASNGVLIDVVNNVDGTNTWHWHEGHPIATYLVSVTAYPYQTYSDTYEGLLGEQMDVKYYVYPENLNRAQDEFAPTVPMIEYFSSLYSEYPFIDEKYSLVEYSGLYAAMEHQTCTSIWYGYLVTYDGTYTMAHELSHHWWGNSVSLGSWHDMWLKEGFACYSEALWEEHLAGPYALREYMLTARDARDLTGSVYRFDISRQDEIVVSEAYDKGAWVMHMLRYILGDEGFFDLIHQVYDTYAFGNYVTETFQNTCEQISSLDLDWFFDQWVYDVWHPEYYWGWSVNDLGGTWQVTGFIDQIQEEGPVFTIPLEMAVVTAGGDTVIVETLTIDEASERYSFEVGDEPVNVLLDPHNWVLHDESVITMPLAGYASHTIDDGAGNDDGRPDPGETVDLVVDVENTGTDLFGLSVTLTTSDPDIDIASPTVLYGDMIHGVTAGNGLSPFTVTIDPGSGTHVVTFILTFADENGYTDADTFYQTVGTPEILLVDDDGGETAENFFFRPCAAKALPFQIWDVSAEGSPGDTLDFFGIVIWFTSTQRENTLTAEDQAALSAFLDDGGGLFISGQDIGYDLVERGNGPDFFTDYLHAGYVTDISTEYFLQGISGDPITNGINLIQLHNVQEYPDVIEPLDGAALTLGYSPSGNAAGITYGGDFRVVYFSVGFEGIQKLVGDSEPLRADILDNIVSWLQFQAAKGDVNEDGRVDILDVIWTVNILLGLTQPTPSQEWAADYDENGSVNVLDALGIVNVILGPVVER